MSFLARDQSDESAIEDRRLRYKHGFADYPPSSAGSGTLNSNGRLTRFPIGKLRRE